MPATALAISSTEEEGIRPSSGKGRKALHDLPFSYSNPCRFQGAVIRDPLSVGFTMAGNPHEISYLNGRYDLSYDANNQLVGSRTEAGAGFSPYNRDWNLDALGNRLNDSVRGQGQFVANFQTRDGEGTYQADRDGFGELIKETLKDGTIRQFTYRTDGRIASVQDNKGTSAEYHYDALGRVIGKTISASGSSFSQLYAYLADERTVLYSVNGAGEKTVHVDGQGVNEHLFQIGSSPKTYITDHLGSVVNSEIAANMQYGLYGEVLGKDPSLSANSPALIYGFAGYEYDSPAGNYRMDWRSYFPGTGRFLSQDPLGSTALDTNYYRYAFNQPQRLTDPTGQIVPLILGYVAFEAGFFIGATINKIFRDVDYSETYLEASPVLNLADQVFPLTSFFANKDTYQLIKDSLSNQRIKDIDLKIGGACE